MVELVKNVGGLKDARRAAKQEALPKVQRDKMPRKRTTGSARFYIFWIR